MTYSSTARLHRRSIVATLGVTLVALTACGSDDEPTDTTDTQDQSEQTEDTADNEFFAMLPQEIQDAGTLRIGVSANFPPGNFEGEDGELDGSEIHLGRAVGELFGVEIEHVTTNFAGLLSGLQADRFDVVLSGMNDTQEREQEANFVNYLATGSNFLVAPGNPESINAPEDLCGLVAAETIGTTYIDELEVFSDDCEAAGEERINVQTFPAGTEVTQAVATGRADFSFASKTANSYFATQSDGAVETAGETINPLVTGFVVPLGEDELVEALQASLQELVDNGRLEEIMAEWGLTDDVLDEVTVNDATS